MFATKIDLLQKLLGTDSRRFEIPIYQRKYKWTSEQCNRLIDDIVKAGQNKKEHFIGTVVYQELPGGTFKVEQLVDGQQRITTVMIILKVLQLLSKIKMDNDDDARYVYNKVSSYMYADKDDPKMGLKLVPSKNDSETFNVIMKNESYDDIISSPKIFDKDDNIMINNFRTIYTKIKGIAQDGYTLRYTVLEGLMLLVIVEMSLDVNDDPQEIFESINSLGLKLSNADLIRNYLLMSKLNQKELYEKYWEVIQDSYITENRMEEFVFNYLMMKKSYAINSDEVYKEYVKFANDEFKGGEIDKEELLKDLFNVAKIYQPFIRKSDSYSANTNMLMQELRDMGQTTAYPLLMKVFLDKERGIIDEDILDKVINLIIVYLVRRTICGVPTHSLRGFMLNLYNRIFKVEVNKKRYFESFYAFLVQLETNDKLKTDSDVKTALETFELYKNVKFATYILYKIENGRYPKTYSEFTLADNVSVEHIMPQTLTDEWISMLGDDAEEIHSMYLNTIGNLSLSSRSKNSIMSNETFITKRDILSSCGSKFVELNKDIKANQTKFSKDEIIARGERLSSIVCSKYELGDVDFEGIKFENSIPFVCTTDYEEVFNNAIPISYSLFGKEIKIDSFSKLITSVSKTLLEKYPEKMRMLASSKYNPWAGGERDCIHYTLDENDKDQLIGERIRVCTNYNSIYCVQFTVLLLEEFGFDASQLVIYLKKESTKDEKVIPKKQRISIIRDALSSLADEELIIYDPANMPKNDDWIKFKTQQLEDLFPLDVETKWDEEYFKSASYFEYNLKSNIVFITFKNFKKTKHFAEKLNDYIDELDLNSDFNSTLCHIKKYQIDYNLIYNSLNKVEAMKAQLKIVLDKAKNDLDNISLVLSK